MSASGRMSVSIKEGDQETLPVAKRHLVKENCVFEESVVLECDPSI